MFQLINHINSALLLLFIIKQQCCLFTWTNFHFRLQCFLCNNFLSDNKIELNFILTFLCYKHQFPFDDIIFESRLSTPDILPMEKCHFLYTEHWTLQQNVLHRTFFAKDIAYSTLLRVCSPFTWKNFYRALSLPESKREKKWKT